MQRIHHRVPLLKLFDFLRRWLVAAALLYVEDEVVQVLQLYEGLAVGQRIPTDEPICCSSQSLSSHLRSLTSDAAMVNAREATQVWGGYGFLNQNAVARHYRDSKILEIGEGTTEVQLMVISRELGLTA